MKFRIVDKKRFTIFALSVLVLFGVVILLIVKILQFEHAKNKNVQQAGVAESILPKNDFAENGAIENESIDDASRVMVEDDGAKNDQPKVVNEYENQLYHYGLSFPDNWYMNNDDSQSKLAKEKQDDGTFLQVGGQTYWSNYANINKYTPQNKPDNFRLLGLTIYEDESASIDDFFKKIGAIDLAKKEEFQSADGVKGIQYVSPSLTDKNPSIVMIFKRDNLFFVFRPAFLYGDSTSSDIMEGIVKSFNFK